MSDVLTMNKSRIYRAGIDEEYYQSNLLFDMIREWSFLAREHGDRAREYIRDCHAATTLEDQHYHAYFSGVAARRAFSIASRILALDAERQRYLHNKPMNWSVL